MSAVNRVTSIDTLPSVWDGSSRWSPDGAPVWSERHDPHLRTAVSSEHPLVLVGRNSNSSGRAGALSAADDLHLAALKLAENHGLDVQSLLPSRDSLADLLMSSGVVVQSRGRGGQTFQNRFLLVDMSSHGLVLSLSTGSAKKLTGDYRQPHALWLVRLALDVALVPGGFFFKRFDRVTRDSWTPGLMLECFREIEESRPIWVADGGDGRWNLSSDQDIVRFAGASSSRREADGLASKRLVSQRELTGARMVEYRVPYALASPCPPGTYRFYDQASKRWYMAIDSPSIYPTEDITAGLPRGTPQVRDEQGDLVDQAATIAWLLANLGRPEMGMRDLWPEMMRRRYSTDSLRSGSGHGPKAFYGGPSKPLDGHSWDTVASWSRAIIQNLDFYETGVLERSLGPGQPLVLIEDCFPPAGEWATTVDFDRIRRHLNRGRTRPRQAWSWSGLPVTVNGVPGFLRPPAHWSEGDAVQWRVDLNSPSDSSTANAHVATPAPAVPDLELTRGIVAALLNISGRPLLRAMSEGDPATGANAELVVEEEAVQARIGRLSRMVEAQQSDLYEEDTDTHEPVMPKLMRAAISKKIEIHLQELAQLSVQQKELAERLHANATSDVGADIGDLQMILDGLQNPRTNRYRDQLRRAVAPINFTVTPISRDRLRGSAVSFKSELVLQATTGKYGVPFDGAYELGAASEAEHTALRGIALLRAGKVPAEHALGSRDHVGVKLALKHLGVDPTSFGLRSCLDSRLLQLGVAAVLPERAEGEPQDEVTTVLDLAQHPDFLKDFGDVAELAVRMVQIYQGQGRARWLNKDTSEMEATLMIATIQSQQGNDGASVLHPFTAAQTARLRTRLERDPARAAVWTWTRKGQPRLNPCPHCGGSWLAPVRFPEALGYLCLECRRDGGSAVTWPVRFDRWVSRTELWVDAGSPITASQPAVVGLPTRTPRQRRELDNSERATILALYGDRGVRVKSIQRNFNVSAETIMAIVKEAGVPTRYAATRRRWGSEDRQA